MSHSDNIESNELDTSIEEWKAELDKNVGDPGYTMAELINGLGIPESTLRRKLNILIREDRCSCGRAKRRSENGRVYCCNVYRLKGEEK